MRLAALVGLAAFPPITKTTKGAHMNYRVQREWLTQHSTIGKLSTVDQAGQQEFQCYTLEPELRHDQVKPRAIPAGTFPLTLRYSPVHGRIVPHVEDVPGFSEIEIHIGNYPVPHPGKDGLMKPADTKGCSCVGKTRDVDFVGQSHAAFDTLFEKMLAAAAPAQNGVQHVGFITYVDPVAAAVTA